MRRTAVAVAISCLGLAAGVFTLDVARDDPGYWFAGSSTLDAAVLLVTGSHYVLAPARAALRL